MSNQIATPAEMIAAVLTATDLIEVESVPVPEVPEGSALIKVALTGLCGSDFGILHGMHPRAKPPLIMGHEIFGKVQLPADSGPQAGAHVVVEPLISCGTCQACRDGHSHVCRTLGLYGIDEPGSLAEYMAIPADKLIEISSEVPAERAVLAEPLAVAVHSVSRAGISSGDFVAVYGGGPIGVFTALVAQHEGARVLLIEPSEERRKVADRLGIDTVSSGNALEEILHRTDGEGADITMDAAAHPAVALEVTATTRVRGTIVVVGVYKSPPALDLRAVNFKEQTIIGVRVYTRADMERAVQLIEEQVLPVKNVPVEVFPLGEATAAFESAMSAGAVLKVMLSSEEARNDR